MSADEAKEFVKRIKKAPPKSTIRRFNQAVKADANKALREATELAEKKASQKAEKCVAKGAAKAAKKGAGKIGQRVVKAIPVVGTVLTVWFWADDIEAKGFVNGTANSALDATPFVGLAKFGVELITGDLIPDSEVDDGGDE